MTDKMLIARLQAVVDWEPTMNGAIVRQEVVIRELFDECRTRGLVPAAAEKWVDPECPLCMWQAAIIVVEANGATLGVMPSGGAI